MLALCVIFLSLSPVFAQTKGKSSPAQPFDDGSRVVQLDEQLAATVDADKKNCDKMAADLKTFNTKNGAEMRRLGQEGSKRTPEQKAEFHKKYGTRVQAATQKLNAGITGCIANPKVQEALKGMH